MIISRFLYYVLKNKCKIVSYCRKYQMMLNGWTESDNIANLSSNCNWACQLELKFDKDNIIHCSKVKITQPLPMYYLIYIQYTALPLAGYKKCEYSSPLTQGLIFQPICPSLTVFSTSYKSVVIETKRSLNEIQWRTSYRVFRNIVYTFVL